MQLVKYQYIKALQESNVQQTWKVDNNIITVESYTNKKNLRSVVVRCDSDLVGILVIDATAYKMKYIQLMLSAMIFG